MADKTMIMNFVEIVILIAIFVLPLAGWLHLNKKKPDSPFLNVAKEWQSLMGAMIGFLSVSIAYTVKTNIDETNRQYASLKKEVAFLMSLETDIQLINAQNVSFRQMYSEKENNDFTQTECQAIYDTITGFSNWQMTIEKILPNIISDLSPETYSVISRATTLKKKYERSMGLVNINDCVVNPVKYRDYLTHTHNTYGDLILQTQKRIRSRISELKK